MFVYPLFRPSHCPFPGYTTVTHVVCVYTIPLMGDCLLYTSDAADE